MKIPKWLARGGGQPNLAYWLTAPDGDAVGSVLLNHGFSEHSGSYQHVVKAWVARGFVVGSYDCRGHGRSEGPRGFISDYREYVRDAEDVLQALSHDERWRQFARPILFGHSTGALATMFLALESPQDFRGVGLTSPYFKLAGRVSPAKRWLVQVVAKVYPQYSEASKLAPHELTRDPKLQATIAADPLRLHRATAGWFSQTLLAQAAIAAAASRFSVPLYVIAGDDDPIADVEETRRIFAQIGSTEKVLRVLAGVRHEPLTDVGREAVIAEFADCFARWAATAR